MIEKLHNRRVSLFTFLLIITLLFSCSEKVQYTYSVPEKTNDGWATAELGEVDVDSEKISHLIRDILNRKFKNIDSVLLVKNEKLILEEYFGDYGRQQAS